MWNEHFITSDDSPDLFVGIRFVDGVPQVIFPHGFNIPNDERELRKDVFRLLSVLQRFTDRKEGDKTGNQYEQISSFPLLSYQYVIQDFFQHGYYTEKEVRHVQSLKGKINWKRTIQQEQPQLDGDNIVYLNFQVKTNQINIDNLLAKIHQYCVYKSFFMFGWLFLSSAYLPPKPVFKADKKLFTNTLQQALNNTFNDSKRRLFQSMIDILNEDVDEIEVKNISIGVNKFDGVWERLIDYVFGEADKEKYFPHANWYVINNGKIAKSSALEPDTIMKWNGKTFVLDAKYYQYGLTGNPSDLPQTSSIQKQITYGKYIIEHANELDRIPTTDVYNAFLMPFNANGGDRVRFVSVGTADWERYVPETPNYAYVLGMLIDTKWLISEYVRHNDKEIEKLSQKIEDSLAHFKKSIYAGD